MHPQRKFSITLLVSLVLWYPTLNAALSGSYVGVPELCIRYLVCFFVSTVLVGIVSSIYGSYSDAAVRAEEDLAREVYEAATAQAEAEAAARAAAATEAIFGTD
jgi:hypothetical protein